MLFLPARSSNYFFFHDPATPDIYTLSLHDALPICDGAGDAAAELQLLVGGVDDDVDGEVGDVALEQLQVGLPHLDRSEEHTSELQSQSNLVCRLLLEKKKELHTRDLQSRAQIRRHL